MKSIEGATTTYFAYVGGNVVYTRSGSTITDYVYAAGLLILRKSGTAVRYSHADHLGNVRLVTYYTNQVKTEFKARYKPFGEIVVLTDNSAVKFKYAGEWLDGTGLYYLRARYYDPAVGRFVSQDPVLGALSVPQTHNRYAYVVNNPLKYTDPSGEFIFLFFLAAVLIGATLNTGIYAATCGETCSAAGYVGAFLGGAAAGAIGYLTAGVGLGAAMLGGAAANMAAYGIEGALAGSFSTEGLLLAGALGAGFGALGARFARGASRAASAGDDLADDILRTRTRLQGIVDDVNGDLGSGRLRLTAAQRRAGPQAAHYGQRLHAEVAERVSHDPFLRSRLTYNIKGVDFRYNMAKNVRFEVTTPGQISSHTNRFITQGISGYVWFITYTR